MFQNSFKAKGILKTLEEILLTRNFVQMWRIYVLSRMPSLFHPKCGSSTTTHISSLQCYQKKSSTFYQKLELIAIACVSKQKCRSSMTTYILNSKCESTESIRISNKKCEPEEAIHISSKMQIRTSLPHFIKM